MYTYTYSRVSSSHTYSAVLVYTPQFSSQLPEANRSKLELGVTIFWGDLNQTEVLFGSFSVLQPLYHLIPLVTTGFYGLDGLLLKLDGLEH